MIDRVKKAPDRTIECAECGVVVRGAYPTQKYCAKCSHEVALRRKAKWGREKTTPEQRARAAKAARETRPHVVEAGKERSEDASIAWPAQGEPKLLWVVRVSVPFGYQWSKNAIWRNAKGASHRFLRKESRAAREGLSWKLKAALAGRKVAHNKLWVDIMVAKPNHRGDAVNVVDLVSDAIQVATGLDDRWYCIRRLDWMVAKRDPALIVGIGQEADEDVLVCSHCGQILPLNAFTRSKSGPLGRNRSCRACDKAGRVRRASRS